MITKPHTKTKLLATAEPRQLTQVLSVRPRTEITVLPKNCLEVFRRKANIEFAPLPPLPPPRRYGAEKASGWISRLAGQHLAAGSRIEIELPLGTPRLISAKALRRLLGGSRGDTLLQWTAGAWVICDDRLRIDLTDLTAQFRVGPVAVYS